MLILGRTSKFSLINKEILGVLNAALSGLLNCSQFMEKMENLVFEYLGWTSEFFPIH